MGLAHIAAKFHQVFFCPKFLNSFLKFCLISFQGKGTWEPNLLRIETANNITNFYLSFHQVLGKINSQLGEGTEVIDEYLKI